MGDQLPGLTHYFYKIGCQSIVQGDFPGHCGKRSGIYPLKKRYLSFDGQGNLTMCVRGHRKGKISEGEQSPSMQHTYAVHVFREYFHPAFGITSRCLDQFNSGIPGKNIFVKLLKKFGNISISHIYSFFFIASSNLTFEGSKSE